MAIAWVENAQLRMVKRTAGAWGAVSAAAAAVTSYSGVALAYVFDWNIVITGVDAGARPTLWTTTYGDGIDVAANTWGAHQVQQQAESDANVTYRAPYLGYADTYRITFVEADAFSGGATRVYRSSLVFGLLWTSGAYTWRTPAPVDYAQAYGLAIAVQASLYIESAPDLVLRASRVLQTATLTPRVLRADVYESARELRGHVDIDNTDGAYAQTGAGPGAGPPAPLQLGNLVKISWGYNTPSPVASQMADLEIAGFEYRRTGGVSVLRLMLAGGWEQLRRNRQRTSIFHAAGADSYGQILTRIFARAGIGMTTSSPSGRQGATKPAFQIAPATSAYDAVRQALDFIADRIIMRAANNATMTEPLASQASAYTFGAGHPIYDAQVALLPPPASEAYAFGAATFGEAIDYASAQAYLGTRSTRRDITSTTPAQAAATAAAHLRQQQLDQPGGALTVPPNCGLEVLDVIDLSDPLISASPVKRRVQAVRWRYDVAAGTYEQHISLGAV